MRSLGRSTPLMLLIMLLAGGAAYADASLAPTFGHINYGTTTVGNPVPIGQFIRNVGDAPTQIVSIQPPAGFSVYSYALGTIDPGLSTSVSISLDAINPGSYGGTVYIYYTANLGTKWTTYTVAGTVECATSPTVTLTDPANGSTKSPNAAGNVILKANASDPDGLDRVEFYVDGSRVASDTAAPWTFAWPAKGGSHSASAIAFNNCGESTQSNSNSFTVQCGKPTVSWTSPAPGSTVSPNAKGNVILKASASHSTGISRVEFWVDGVKRRTDTSAPYAWAWPASSGSHTAYAVAYSVCSSVKKTPNVTFTVN